MSRLIAVAFVLALASSTEGMPLRPQQPAEVLTLVREACGPGMQGSTACAAAIPPSAAPVRRGCASSTAGAFSS
jgi:hypothetical protein